MNDDHDDHFPRLRAWASLKRHNITVAMRVEGISHAFGRGPH